MKIAEHAQNVIQEGAKNLLVGGLRKKISLDSPINIVDGQLVQIEKIHNSYQEALSSAMLKIPYGKLGLFFVDNREIRSGSETIIETIKSTFSERGDAHIFTGSESTPLLKDWLWDPKKRLNDMVIIGPQHQCNGIETEIVVHIYPADCPWCGISNADPVIISRATAMLILATYQRFQCCCGWEQNKAESTVGWLTPQSTMTKSTGAAIASCYNRSYSEPNKLKTLGEINIVHIENEMTDPKKHVHAQNIIPVEDNNNLPNSNPTNSLDLHQMDFKIGLTERSTSNYSRSYSEPGKYKTPTFDGKIKVVQNQVISTPKNAQSGLVSKIKIDSGKWCSIENELADPKKNVHAQTIIPIKDNNNLPNLNFPPTTTSKDSIPEELESDRK